MNPEIIQSLQMIEHQLNLRGGRFDINRLSQRLNELDYEFSAKDIPMLLDILHLRNHDLNNSPKLIIDAFEQLVRLYSSSSIVDPWAGAGGLIGIIQDKLGIENALACSPRLSDATLGKILAKDVVWHSSEPLKWLNSINDELDLVISIPPFGVKDDVELSLLNTSGEVVTLKDYHGNLVLTAASKKLKPNGAGIFVVMPNFFMNPTSVFHQISSLGLGIEAAFELPYGAFAPSSYIKSYIIVVRKFVIDRIFVAQFSYDANNNQKIIANFHNREDYEDVSQGSYVQASTFKGLDEIRIQEKLLDEQRKFGFPPTKLKDISESIILGKYDVSFSFQESTNAIYVPLTGEDDILDSFDYADASKQNYAQVVINQSKSFASFVMNFLNSDLGKEMQESAKLGTTTLRLTTSSLMNLLIFIPNLATQIAMIEIETNIIAGKNLVQSVDNDLTRLHNNLWSNPQSLESVKSEVRDFNKRISSWNNGTEPNNIEKWIEALPFPLASILRVWQATPSGDYKTKVDHLLHFFEASAEFSSIILLSAFSSNDTEFRKHKENLNRGLENGKLSFERATFGVWKIVLEYLGKQTRRLLNGEQEEIKFCMEIFACKTPLLPKMLSDPKLLEIVTKTNRMRNNWTGHGGIVGQEESKLRHEQLIGELHNLKHITESVWDETQLIKSNICIPRKSSIENEISVLTGSNSQFLSEKIATSEFLYTDSLYIFNKGHSRGLRLLPLICFEASPTSAKQACYFYNRLEKGNLRYVSYHFSDVPEFNEMMTIDSEINKILFMEN